MTHYTSVLSTSVCSHLPSVPLDLIYSSQLHTFCFFGPLTPVSCVLASSRSTLSPAIRLLYSIRPTSSGIYRNNVWYPLCGLANGCSFRGRHTRPLTLSAGASVATAAATIETGQTNLWLQFEQIVHRCKR